ncbi:MAG: hypothetical protein AAF604_18815 [Acidobacteriota bacterium]
MLKKCCWTLTLAALLLAAPTFAANDFIAAGPDLWETTSNGSTRADFLLEPIPAGFFCNGGEAFRGAIGFKGVPLATHPNHILGSTDTIVQRLDDAVLNDSGHGSTRVQVIAMEFEGLDLVKTDCGTYSVRTVLEGEQPITNMEIIRTSDDGGIFLAEIAVRVRLIFTPIEAREKGARSLVRELAFAPAPNAGWSTKAGHGGVETPTAVMVDTDADRQPDTWVYGTDGFVTGWSPDDNGNLVEGSDCHCTYSECGHKHCLQPSSECWRGCTAGVDCPSFCALEPML